MQPRCYMSDIVNWWLMSWMQSTDILGLALSESLGWINSQYFKSWEISMKTPDSWPLLTFLPHIIDWRRVVDAASWIRACAVQFVTFFTTPGCNSSPHLSCMSSLWLLRIFKHAIPVIRNFLTMTTFTSFLRWTTPIRFS